MAVAGFVAMTMMQSEFVKQPTSFLFPARGVRRTSFLSAYPNPSGLLGMLAHEKHAKLTTFTARSQNQSQLTRMNHDESQFSHSHHYRVYTDNQKVSARKQ
jgi:hypothetical protein